MSDVQSGFPRRDVEGRIIQLSDLLGIALAGLVVGLLVLLLFDWSFALIGMGQFGRANGWLAVILPAWVFVEDFRAWRGGTARIVAALAGAAVGVTAGLLAGGAATHLPRLWTGAIAAGVFALSYAVIWFYGVRWLTAGRVERRKR